MITLSRLHDAGSIVVNADLIETLEATPDTVVTLVTRRRFVVANSIDEIVARIVSYRQSCTASPGASVPVVIEVRESEGTSGEKAA